MIWNDVDTALAEVPVNAAPLTDDTDFKTLETAVAYNASGMALYWHFYTPAGAYTVTQVTPTSGGSYDWAHQAQGMYTIEIPASGGASINNDTEGWGRFTGVATGVLPWVGPWIGFRAAALNDALVEGGDSLDVNVTQFGGTNGTFSGGRPEANTTHLAGQAVTAGAGVTFPSSVASPTNITAGTITTVTNLTNAPSNGDLTATMKASVNAEVLDVLNTDTFGEPSGAPGATVSLREKLGWLYMALRNRIDVTADAKNFYDDSGNVEWTKGLSDDGTTYTETEGTTP